MAEAVDLSISISKRAEAIKFLIHLIADAHHPLHVGFRADHGGNNIDIRL